MDRQGTAVGIAMGIVRFAAVSDDTVFELLDSFRRQQQALAKAKPQDQVLEKLEEVDSQGRIQARIANARRTQNVRQTSWLSFGTLNIACYYLYCA